MDSEKDPAPTRTDRNNPLGQNIPSPRVGGEAPNMKHDQSAELVDEVKKKADQIQKNTSDVKLKEASSEYDPKGPERQPGKVVRQEQLGKIPRQSQEGQYTQDNEEENPRV